MAAPDLPDTGLLTTRMLVFAYAGRPNDYTRFEWAGLVEVSLSRRTGRPDPELAAQLATFAAAKDLRPDVELLATEIVGSFGPRLGA